MMFKQKLHLRAIFIAALASALILLSVLLTLLFFGEIYKYANFAYNENRHSILEKTKLLLKANARRAAKYYSAYFDNLVSSSKLIAQQIGENYDEASVVSIKHLEEMPKVKFMNVGEGIQMNNFTYKDKAIVFVPFNIYNNNNVLNTKHSKIIQYLFFELQKHVSNIWKKTNAPYMHDVWLILKSEKGYYAMVYPNKLAEVKLNSKNWFNAITNSRKYFKLLSPVDNPDRKTIWTSVHSSVLGKRIQTVMSPVYTEGGKYIGGAAITLIVDSSLGDIIGVNQGEDKMPDEKEKSVVNNFTFVMNKENELLAFPIEYAELFSLPANKVKKSKLFYNGYLYDSKDLKIQKLAEKIKNTKIGVFDITIKGSHYIFTYCKLENGWILVEVVPEKSLLGSVIKSIKKFTSTVDDIYIKIILFTFVLLIISILFCFIVFSKYIIKPIQNMCKYADEIGSGNFDLTPIQKGVVEVEHLSSSFSYLLSNLKKYTEDLTEEIRKRLCYETEVKVAGDIQLSLLPKITEKFKNDYFDIAAVLCPAKDASGDFYDFFYLDNNILAVLIADVSGKGISAAFFMAVAKTVIKSAAIRRHTDGPGNVLSLANNMLNHDNEKSMFVTAFIAFYDIDSGRFLYSNAGHHSAIYLNSKGECDEFGRMNNLALGIIPDVEYTTQEIFLNKNDRVILYTDGVSEAINGNDEEFGEGELKQILSRNSDKDSDKLANIIINNVRNFEEGNKFDDITLLILEHK